MRILRACSLLGLVTAAGLTAQADWRVLSPAVTPGPTARAALTHDPVRCESVLFVGSATWTWNGAVWQQRSPGNQPAPREGHVMVYEVPQNRVLLFGGTTPGIAQPYGDTWVWDGTGWTQLNPTNRPPARYGAAAAYDLQRSRAVIYGGNDLGFRNDTWEWDGNDWAPRNPPTQPPYLGWPSMSYDVDRGVAVLFGGWVSHNAVSNQTWEWDGADWRIRLSSNVPPARAGAVLEYDTVRDVHVMFGGESFPSLRDLNDTWEWNGEDWTLRSPTTSVQAQAYRQATFDGWAGRLLLLGDRTLQYYSTDVASIASYGTRCNTSLGPLTLSSVAGPPWIGDTIDVELASLPARCFPYLVVGLQRVQVDLGPFGIPGCWQHVDSIGRILLGTGVPSARWSWQTPNDPAVVGVTFQVQGGAWLAGGNNVFGAATSNGLEVTIGQR